MEKMLKSIESMDPEEREKLRKVLNKDKQQGGETMDWMYKQSKPEEEEYLLGRRVDKYIEDEGKVEEDKDAPGASFNENLARRADMDMHAKMREDPLYAIRQREEEAKRKLLSNPIKMKQLEKLIHDKERQSKKKQKKKKKKKKHSDSSSESSGDELLQKYLEIRKQKEMKALRRNAEFETEHSERSHNSDSHRSKDKERSFRKRHSSNSSEEADHSSHRHVSGSKAYGLVTKDVKQTQHRQRSPEPSRNKTGSRKFSHRSSSDSPRKMSRSRRSSSRSRSPHRTKMSKSHRSRSRSPHRTKRVTSRSPQRAHRRSRSRSRSRSPARYKRDRKSSPQSNRRDAKPEKNKKEKLSSDEMAKRRAEMLENAQWRDKQRKENVKRYKEEAKREKDELDNRSSAGAFLNPLLMEHAAQTSVEDRIKRNKYNVQRTRADLDKNFAKR